MAVNWMRLDWIFCLEFLGEFLEKGSSREHTKNRVARWGKMFGGNSGVLRWIAKRNLMGEFKMGLFWGFGRWSTWFHWGGGTLVLLFCVFGGFFGVLSVMCEWGTYLDKICVGARCFALRTTFTGEGVWPKNNLYWRGSLT
jgi:hypothetical protein